jgi:hypothetical protein
LQATERAIAAATIARASSGCDHSTRSYRLAQQQWKLDNIYQGSAELRKLRVIRNLRHIRIAHQDCL